MTYGLTGEIWLIISSSSSVCPPLLLQHPEARPQAPECGLHIQPSCFTPLAQDFSPMPQIILGPSMGPPAYQWYTSQGSSFTSMYPGSSPPWSTLQLEASKQLQTSIPPVPNPRVGLHLQASFFTSLAPGFQPHTSNHEPSVFSFFSSIHPSPPSPHTQKPDPIPTSTVWPSYPGLKCHTSSRRLPDSCLKS